MQPLKVRIPPQGTLAGMDTGGGKWPQRLGFNELTLKPQAHLVATIGEHPLLATMEVGRGRSLAWTSDIGPHWCPTDFIEWPGYKQLWVNAAHWLAKK